MKSFYKMHMQVANVSMLVKAILFLNKDQMVWSSNLSPTLLKDDLVCG